jgi:polar amino acid transport system substrate-binding protein
MSKINGGLGLAVIASFVLSTAAIAENKLEAAQHEGHLTIGFMVEPPFIYTENGEITGADYAVAKHILAKIGVKNLKGTLQEFQALIPGLIAGRFDLNTPFIITPARCKQLLFTTPTYVLADSFIVKAGNPKKLHSYDDARARSDAKVGYYAGAIYGQTLKTLGFKPDQIVPVPDQNTALAALRSGRLDAFINTSIGNQVVLNLLKDPELERAEPFTQPKIDGKEQIYYTGYSFRKEDRELYDAFNKELSAFIGTPEHLALVKQYGFTDAEIAPAVGVKTADICGQ